jgi:dolichol kinase
MILVTVLADAASAIVGLRWGRRKWPHNAGKSLVGTAAGTAAALAFGALFLGWPLGLLTAAWFLVVDVAAPVPVPVSDNLLNPIGLAALYTALAPRLHPIVALP